MIARAVRFVGVGGLATLVHVAVALVCQSGLGLPGLAANLAGWLTAMAVSYFGHLHVTFGVAAAHATQAPRFVATSVSGLIVSSAIVAAVTSAGGSFALAMGCVAVGVPAATYALLHLWVFNGRAPAQGVAPADGLVALALGLVFLMVFWGQTLDHDVVWYHVATRKWLEGAGLYIDIIEVNPPLNFYLTLPVVWLADATGLDDAAAQHLVLAGLMGVSLTFVARELGRGLIIAPLRRGMVLAGIGLVLILFALRDAGQREHLFILLALPWIVAQADPAGRPARHEAGLAVFAALGMCLKPFFVVFPLAVLLVRALRARRIAALFPVSAFVFLGVGLAYIAMVALWHPAYLTDIVPMARLVYGAYQTELVNVIGVVGPSLSVLILAGVWTLSRPEPPAGAVLFFAVCLAGIVSYVWQGTGFGYHAMPFLIFGAIACVFASLDPRIRLVALVALATLSLQAVNRGYYHNGAIDRIVPVIEAEGPVESLLVVTTHVFAGPIIAEKAGAEWVSSYPAQWLVPGALNALDQTDCAADPERCHAIEAIAARNRADLLDTMARARPEMIVFDKAPGYFDRPFSWHDWLGADPSFAPIMAEYRLHAEDDRFTYWLHGERARP